MSHICPYFQQMKPGGNIKPNPTHPIQVYLLIYITSNASFHALPPPHSTVWCCWLSVLCKRLWCGNLCFIATAGPLVGIKLESDDERYTNAGHDVLRERVTFAWAGMQQVALNTFNVSVDLKGKLQDFRFIKTSQTQCNSFHFHFHFCGPVRLCII